MLTLIARRNIAKTPDGAAGELSMQASVPTCSLQYSQQTNKSLPCGISLVAPLRLWGLFTAPRHCCFQRAMRDDSSSKTTKLFNTAAPWREIWERLFLSSCVVAHGGVNSREKRMLKIYTTIATYNFFATFIWVSSVRNRKEKFSSK